MADHPIGTHGDDRLAGGGEKGFMKVIGIAAIGGIVLNGDVVLQLAGIVVDRIDN